MKQRAKSCSILSIRQKQSFQDTIWKKASEGKKNHEGHSQFNGFVPHDDVAWEHKGLHVDNVDVPSFCADVQPFTLEGQVAESYSVDRRRGVLETEEREVKKMRTKPQRKTESQK